MSPSEPSLTPHGGDNSSTNTEGGSENSTTSSGPLRASGSAESYILSRSPEASESQETGSQEQEAGDDNSGSEDSDRTQTTTNHISSSSIDFHATLEDVQDVLRDLYSQSEELSESGNLGESHRADQSRRLPSLEGESAHTRRLYEIITGLYERPSHARHEALDQSDQTDYNENREMSRLSGSRNREDRERANTQTEAPLNQPSAESHTSNSGELSETQGNSQISATVEASNNSDTGSDQQPATNANPYVNVFDHIMDTISTIPNGQDLSSRGSRNILFPDSNPNQDASERTGITPVSNVEGATVFTTGSTGATGSSSNNSSAIVITVNYMFMDGASEAPGGRTGSLVVTIPNNSNNREPQVISQFISLATRMAYNALFLNGPKPKPGITVEKFNSFESLNIQDLADTSCSICFEQFDALSSAAVDEDLLTNKRRKLSATRHVASGTATPENVASGPAQISSSTEGNARENGYADDTTQSQGEIPPIQKPYLCDEEKEFGHVPLQLPCKHVFGKSCIAHWLKESTSCPLCRLSVADPEQNPRRGTPQISFFRFGNANRPQTGQTNPVSSGGSRESDNRQEPTGNDNRADSAGSTEAAQSREHAHNNSSNEGALPWFLRRVARAFHTLPGRVQGETPPAPFEAGGRTGSERTRNPPFSPVINGIHNYLRREVRRPLPGESGVGSTSLFTTGVASRRTPAGVETTSSDLGYDALMQTFRERAAEYAERNRSSSALSGEAVPNDDIVETESRANDRDANLQDD